MPQNQGFILDISLVVEVSNKCISIKLQCTSQKIRTHISRMKMNISNTLSFILKQYNS